MRPVRPLQRPPRVVLAFLLGALSLSGLLLASPVQAALPELRIAPLRYDQHLELGQPKTGIIDASNPTGSTIHVQFQVQAFRQINARGELEYYDDERIASAITPAIPEFDLGPREAIRTRFTIDPNKLGPGGAYGVIFLRSTDRKVARGQINTSARVGTLLLLDVGPGGTKSGNITRLGAPGLVYGGQSLAANFNYANTGQGPQALAFSPKLQASLGWSGQPQAITGPFVFPGRSRPASATVQLGNRFGLLPLTVRDTTGGAPDTTRWVFAVTGIWTWLFPLILILLLGLTPLAWWQKLLRTGAPKSPMKKGNKLKRRQRSKLQELRRRLKARRRALRRLFRRYIAKKPYRRFKRVRKK